MSTVAQEKARNPRLGGGRSLEQFRETLAGLNLPCPTCIDHAVPGNRQCGVCPADLPEKPEQYCRQMRASRQG